MTLCRSVLASTAFASGFGAGSSRADTLAATKLATASPTAPSIQCVLTHFTCSLLSAWLLPLVVHLRGEALDLVVVERDVLGVLAQAETDALRRSASLLQFILAEHKPRRRALHIDCRCFFAAGVDDRVSLNGVSI